MDLNEPKMDQNGTKMDQKWNKSGSAPKMA